MTRVLVVKFNKAIEPIAALEHLAGCAEGEVVVCTNLQADYRLCSAFFGQITANERLAPRHQYVVLLSTLTGIPEDFRAYLTEIHAAVLQRPFDEDTLLATIRDAASRCEDIAGSE